MDRQNGVGGSGRAGRSVWLARQKNAWHGINAYFVIFATDPLGQTGAIRTVASDLRGSQSEYAPGQIAQENALNRAVFPVHVKRPEMPCVFEDL